MQAHANPDQTALRARLLERLRPLVASHAAGCRGPGVHVYGPQLFSYCALTAERIARARLAHPSVAIVLSGCKEVWLGDAGRRYLPGEVLVLPGQLDLDVVNVPDERSGRYESLLLEVPSVPASLARAAVGRSAAEPVSGMRVQLTPDLVDALAHAATTLADSDHVQALAEHRVAEVLLLLRSSPAAQPLFEVGLVERVTWMVLGDPSHGWTAAELAQALGLGSSTLRRRLAESGATLREIIAAARMQLAQELLAGGRGTVAQAAEAVGYASRSHFARRFRRVHGVAPRQRRSVASA